MAKNLRKIFTVEGTGPFPFDMLRYDHCWPYREAEDSPQLAVGYGEPARRVVLMSDSPQAPTQGRWESHLWRVIAYGEARDPIRHPTMSRGAPPYQVRD